MAADQGVIAQPIVIGLDADLTSGSAQSGIAIKRGVMLALDDINRQGGVNGIKLALVALDHHGNPARGIANMEKFAAMPNLVAVVGGLHTPVALAELDIIHRHRIIYLSPWAAGTAVVDNGYQPNFVFRVSVRDQFAGPFLVSQAFKDGYRTPGLLLEQTGWGRSNSRAIQAALKGREQPPAGTQWFLWGTNDLTGQILSLKHAGADVILFVGNAPEGTALVHSLARLPDADRLPVISHWGITGGRFFHDTKDQLKAVDLKFLQTYSFLLPPFVDKAAKLVKHYRFKWPAAASERDIFSPAGTAHAYDLVHLLARAMEAAGTIERSKVRQALEHLGPHSGLVRYYNPPFTPGRHDALDASDYRLARFAPDGAIEPVVQAK